MVGLTTFAFPSVPAIEGFILVALSPEQSPTRRAPTNSITRLCDVPLHKRPGLVAAASDRLPSACAQRDARHADAAVLHRRGRVRQKTR